MFIVFSLPRSRSTWLSQFLSHDGLLVGHDVGADSHCVSDFLERVGDGSCETGAAFAWPLIRKLAPHCRFAVVRRPLGAVIRSLAKFGLEGADLQRELERRALDLFEISGLPGTLTFDHDELNHFAGARDLYEHCTGATCDPAWFKRMKPLNIQVDMPTQLAKLARNHDRIEALKAEARGMMAHA